VVFKLFNIVQPRKAYFGQKDGMQCIAVKRMVKDMNFPIDVVIGPTVRESDGLAKSSRNTYLSPEERKIAPILFQSLSTAKQMYASGKERDASVLVAKAKSVLETQPSVKLDYLDICDMDSGTIIEGLW
jgi:pantoate--beta-alanine ligase